ncbi:replication protein A 14 kDa subunit B-like [Anopheles stephensi]|uniref:replication protein A 14 kDa subunit B-like n=1 Tax=Anopheles stephensi TaxID=30069 RepID=UPI0007D46ED8|nr:replication protein A 14 kDa subunit B-like [Anopheles stephensi]
MQQFERRSIVNGALLKRHVGQCVSIHLKVDRAADGCKSFSGKTTDGVTVQVALSEPLNGACSGWVEVIGVAAPNDSVRCKQIITYFSTGDKAENFDVDGHNMLCTLLSVCKEPFDLGPQM